MSESTTIQSLIAALNSGDDTQAEAAALEIAALGEKAIPRLAELLTSPKADERWWATRCLSEIAHPDIPALIAPLLHDPEVNVRQCAALGLRVHPDKQAIPDLISLLDNQDRLLARLAADALVATGKEAVPALLAVMQNGPHLARLEAARALALVGDERAVPVFFAVIRDGDSSLIEHWANQGLERMGIGMVFFEP